MQNDSPNGNPHKRSPLRKDPRVSGIRRALCQQRDMEEGRQPGQKQETGPPGSDETAANARQPPPPSKQEAPDVRPPPHVFPHCSEPSGQPADPQVGGTLSESASDFVTPMSDISELMLDLDACCLRRRERADETRRNREAPSPLTFDRNYASSIRSKASTKSTASAATDTAFAEEDLKHALTSMGFDSFKACLMDALGDRDYLVPKLPVNPEPTGQWLDAFRMQRKELKKALKKNGSEMGIDRIIRNVETVISEIREVARVHRRSRLTSRPGHLKEEYPRMPVTRQTRDVPATPRGPQTGCTYAASELTTKLRNLDSVFTLRRSIFDADAARRLDSTIVIENLVGIHLSDGGRRSLFQRACERFGRSPELGVILMFGRPGERGTKSITADDGPCECCGVQVQWTAVQNGSSVKHQGSPCSLVGFALTMGFVHQNDSLIPPDRLEMDRKSYNQWRAVYDSDET